MDKVQSTKPEKLSGKNRMWKNYSSALVFLAVIPVCPAGLQLGSYFAQVEKNQSISKLNQSDEL